MKPQSHLDQIQHQCAIALGSNLGASLTILQQACTSLDDCQGINLIACSRWHKTKAIGPPQPDYLNGCVLVKTILSPPQLLKKLQEIEHKFGRQRTIRWGARTLDLDIILYDDLVIEQPDLQIPHPRMKERAFVLNPLAEIAPHWVEPLTGKTIRELSDDLS